MAREEKLKGNTMALPIILCILAAKVAAQKPSTAGFISIDCGLDGISNYTAKATGIVYSSDEPYTSRGRNMKVSPDVNLTSIHRFYATVRSFPDGVRNCYTLGPVQRGLKYRIKAEFYYGNYDGQRNPPTFDLYIGVNLWIRLERIDFLQTEVITVIDTDSILVCLVNTEGGTPFISELDLRPIAFSMYDMVQDSSTAVVFDYYTRNNYGGNDQIRFPDDIYDRRWSSPWWGKRINTTKRINLLAGDRFWVPQAVLQTAREAETLSERLNISTFPFNTSQEAYVYIYFAEIVELGINETREFNVYAGEELVFGPLKPRFLQQDVYFTPIPGRQRGLEYSLRATNHSTLPPIINADETFIHIKTPLLPTIDNDVRVMLELKKQYSVSREWEGDPCVPRKYIWKGLTCVHDNSNYSTITSLDMSRSGLSGRIPHSIANLSNLKSLDLSRNSFTGEVPENFGALSYLNYLNLEGNNLTGTVPLRIYERAKNGSLNLRIEGNPDLCMTADECNSVKSINKKNISKSIVILIVVLLLTVVIIGVSIMLWRKMQASKIRDQLTSNISDQQGDTRTLLENPETLLYFEARQLSEAEIANITENFSQPIGRGSSGTVYRGTLNNGTPVAVKLLLKTDQGERQFKAEAELLTRVHHRYLVSLLGYCIENMALVYEFAPRGSLADYLSGDSAQSNILNLDTRLQLALEVAQGLDYLHNGCKPPIVHRDLKTSNILLTEKFEVLITDFGLSKSVSFDGSSCISTIVAGTPGYLDPEYQHTKRLSEKSDVYSFGVILLELVTGRPPLSGNNNLSHITDEVQAKIEKGDIAEIEDPRISHDCDLNSLRKVVDMALSCTAHSSIQRPTIREIVAILAECLKSKLSTEFSDGRRSSSGMSLDCFKEKETAGVI